MKISQSGIWLCHSLQFAVMLTVLSNLVQYYVYLGQLRRKGTFLSRQGPMLLVLVASLLLMVHPTVFLLKDLQLIQPMCGSSVAMMAMKCCTSMGLVMLLYAAMWGTEGFAVLWAGLQKRGWLQ